MTKREIRKRVKQLIAREVRSGAFTEPPDHIQDEPDAIQDAWEEVCKEVADMIDRGDRA